MKRLVIIATVLVVSVTFAAELGGFGGPMVAGMMPSFTALNDRLEVVNETVYGGSRGPEFSGPVFLLGGQGSGFVEGFSIGGWGAGFFKEAKGDSSRALIGYGMGYGEFGYRFNIADLLFLGPMFEIGGGGVGFTMNRYRSGGFGEPGDTTHDFWEDSYDAGKGFVNLGAAADISVVFPRSEKRTAFVGLNLKAGYLYTVYDSGWWDEYGKIMDEPRFNLSGPFVSLGVIFGGKTDWSGNSQDWDADEWEEE